MAPLSEYRRKFKQKGEDCQKDYVVRYNYMVGRRSTEMSHTSIDWDLPSDTDSEISSARSDSAPVKNIPEQKNARKLPESRVKDESTSTTDAQIIESELIRPTVQLNDIAVQCGKNKIKSTVRKNQKEQSKKKSCNKAENKPVLTKTTDKKVTTSSSNKVLKTKAPLIPYGWAYRGPIDNHKTFNVKVPEKEASESALRALKRRQLDIQRKEEEKRQQALQRKNTQALFDLVEKDKSGWISEYQRNFSGCKYSY